MSRLLKRLLGVTALAGTVVACSSQTTTDINALLGSSAASTALSYVAALNPTISGYLNDADVAIAANAPQILSDTCGAVSMGNEIVTTIEALDPTLIPATTQASLAASYAATTPLCPPNAPPANVAAAAEDMLALYKGLSAAWTKAGVAPAAKVSLSYPPKFVSELAWIITGRDD